MSDQNILKGRKILPAVIYIFISLFLVQGVHPEEKAAPSGKAPITLPGQKEGELFTPLTSKVKLKEGESKIIQYRVQPSKSSQKLTISLSQEDIAEARIMKSVIGGETSKNFSISHVRIYLKGKKPGMSTVTISGDDNNIYGIFDLEVVSDLAQIKQKLHTILPQEKDISVSEANGFITLTGTVSSASNLSQILLLVEPYAPIDRESKKPKIINMLQVGGVQQVMLEVRVSEMSRNVLKRMGINLNMMNAAGEFGLTLLNNLSNVRNLANLGANPSSAYPIWNPYGGTGAIPATPSIPYTYPSPGYPSGLPPIAGSSVTPGRGSGGSSSGFPVDPLGVSQNVTGILRFFVNGVPWTVLVDALKENGLLKVLAEPTLITISGQTANFLAGGEFPIPIPSGLGTVSIEYKPFGVGLNFTPTVLSSGKIHMKVAPEVSDLNFAQALVSNGFVIPSIDTRRVSTSIELGDGQSFAIAGLLKEDVREVVTKFPLLGDLPILGVLFRSSSFQKRETELIVIVTPHLVKPLDMAKQTLPTDQFIEPDDFDFYLMGRLEGKLPALDEPKYTKPMVSKGKEEKSEKPEKNFGHIIPKN
jgi:pilus assembly protein CpaC